MEGVGRVGRKGKRKGCRGGKLKGIGAQEAEFSRGKVGGVGVGRSCTSAGRKENGEGERIENGRARARAEGNANGDWASITSTSISYIGAAEISRRAEVVER